jgi:hypothetical protein
MGMKVARNIALGLGMFAAQSALTFAFFSLDKAIEHEALVHTSVLVPVTVDLMLLPPALALLLSQKHKH